MNRARQEQGAVLAAAVIVMMVILGLGLALLRFTDSEQTAAAREQSSERAFNVAEAAMNAQVGQLARAWPRQVRPFEPRCTEATTTASNGCPSTVSLSAGYGRTSGTSCAAGAQTEAWGSSLTNEWTTYVRDDAAGTTYFNSSAEQGEPAYDANKDNKLWVRAVGVVNCRIVTLVTLVSRQLTSVPFPKDVVSGNWFAVTNQGKKEIVRAEGEGQPGEFSLRCEGRASGRCEEWDPKKEQIKPYIKGPPNPSPLLNESQLAAVRSLAEAEGTYRSTALGNCPQTVEELSGRPAWLECGDLQFTSDGTVNSLEQPGFLVLGNGSITFKGTTTVYGVLYALNPTNSPGASIVLGGATTVYGALDADGLGGIELGSNQVNLIYTPRAILELQGSAGATPTRNAFRVLPVNQ
jgi:Tfp pilus assembly protein PilX